MKLRTVSALGLVGATLAVAAPAVAAPAPGDQATARRIACEQYAVGAATFDYRDLGPWQARLTRGTSPELTAKLNSTAGTMNQVLQPLQWVSTARLAGAEVTPLGDDVWRAKCFVNVHTTNTKNPQGRNVVSQYVITLDKKRNWQITDIGSPAQPAR
ncbi:hypothetical protein [Tsukamurella sp. 1534]|uniref:hypothetical protein n=1 Tax=Tsukamurella sp. 1534 TaxID=1151061 RepID=UPI0002D56915|nr:hypothetical protein [Tsukamurella sp. 1534]